MSTSTVAAAIARGGSLKTPLLVRQMLDSRGNAVQQYEAQDKGALPVSPDNLAAIKAAMVKVAGSPEGTAYAAFKGFPLPVAAKSGAAENQDPDRIDPYLRMLGGEFISHGDQQKATMRVADTQFPGLKGQSDFTLHEEWYSLKNFAPDVHVILVNDTQGMRNWQYERPPFPATWARRHGRGRVFFTSMGHRDDVWTNPIFQNLLLGALAWATGQVEADLTPNLAAVTPKANEMPEPPPPRPGKSKAKD